MNHQHEKLMDMDLDSTVILALKRGPALNDYVKLWNFHVTSQILETRQVLHFSCTELKNLTNLSSEDIFQLKDKVAVRHMHHRCYSALEMLKKEVPINLQHWKLSTTCNIMDSVLRGGILSGVLTEITGESGTGKTQLCLQLCISVQFNKELAGGAVFICTEDAFPSKRLQQLIKYYGKFLPGQNLGDKIFVEHVADFETLEFCVKKKLPTLLNRGLVKLIVIDSVTALFRCHYDSSQTVNRAKHLIEFASALRNLAHQYSIVVICINQVSANVNKVDSFDSNVIPALGLTWSNQMTCRIILSRFNTGESQQSNTTRRGFKILFAPHLSQSEIDIHIDEFGVHGVSNSQV